MRLRNLLTGPSRSLKTFLCLKSLAQSGQGTCAREYEGWGPSQGQGCSEPSLKTGRRHDALRTVADGKPDVLGMASLVTKTLLIKN